MNMGKMKRAVFLDRDGTLVKAYRGRPANVPEEIELLSGVPQGLRMLKDAGYMLVVVTNQGGVGLGYTTVKTLHEMHERMGDLLIMEQAPPPDAVYFCPHKPDEGCPCRKPKPGMITRAAQELSIDLRKSYMIGDDPRDMEAAKAAGLRKKVMVVSDRFEPCDVADILCPTFLDAARVIKIMGAAAKL